MAESTENDQTLEHGQPLQQDDSKEPVAEQAPDFDVDRPDEEEDDFGEEEEDDDDDFGDFGDADDAGDFGDFETSDDFPTDEFPMAQEKKQPTDAEEYVRKESFRGSKRPAGRGSSLVSTASSSRNGTGRCPGLCRAVSSKAMG